ncbi:MAG: hypothetical protein O7D91_21380 [Planctomycetota bacterium]|nr:hypothetical protein [Planctomycetota bacterium]
MRIVLSPGHGQSMRRAVRDAAGKVLRLLVFSPNSPLEVEGDDLAVCKTALDAGVLVETKQPVPADLGEVMVARIQSMADQIESLTSQLTAAEDEVARLNRELSEATAPPTTRKKKTASSAA